MPYSCPICGHNFKTRQSLSKHKANKHGPYFCECCGKRYNTPDGLQNNISANPVCRIFESCNAHHTEEAWLGAYWDLFKNDLRLDAAKFKASPPPVGTPTASTAAAISAAISTSSDPTSYSDQTHKVGICVHV